MAHDSPVHISSVVSGKTISELETEMLNGQSAQGPMTAAHVYHMLNKHNLLDKFPLFTAIHKVPCL